MTLCWDTMDSPVGELLLVAHGERLRVIRFEREEPHEPPADARRGGAALKRAARQLGEYFQGRRRTFDLELDPVGTPFQRRVWRELGRIGYGATITYGDLARRVGNPRASRAVGAANGQNPIPIVLPCHRVIGSDGRLTGFGGGLDVKRWLLELEGALSPLLHAARRR